MSTCHYTDSQVNSIFEPSASVQTISREECPSCHVIVQSGKFCSECGSRLASSCTSPESSLFSEVNFRNQTSYNESLPTDSGMPTSVVNFRSTGQLLSGDLFSNSRPAYSGRRFSMDIGESEYRINNGQTDTDLQSLNRPSSGLLSYPNAVYRQYSVQYKMYHTRRRASTSNVLAYGTGGLTSEDTFANDTSYDIDPFESSTDPLYSRPQRTGSLSLDTAESFGIHGFHSSLDTTLRRPSLLNSRGIDLSLGLASGLEYPGDITNDTSLSGTNVSMRKGQSLSDVDMNSRPDSLECGLASGIGSLLGDGIGSMQSGSLISRDSLTGTTSVSGAFDGDVYHPLIIKRNSVGSYPCVPSLDSPPFGLDNTSPTKPFSQVVRGAVSFPSRSVVTSFKSSLVGTSVNSVQPDTASLGTSPLSQASMSSLGLSSSPPNTALVESITEPLVSGSPAVPTTRSFDANESKKMTEFVPLRGRVLDMVCTQNGSKSLQNFFNSSMSDNVREALIDEVVAEIGSAGCSIICDTFGNYFYQILFSKAISTQREVLVRRMLYPSTIPSSGSTIYEISVNKTGTFAFQNIIDFMTGNRVLGELIVGSLKNAQLADRCEDVTLRLIKDNKGTHIIQRIMNKFDIDQWESIYKILLKNCFTVAMDRNGSMVLRLCYDNVDIEKKERISSIIIEHARELATDPVGNYVVQHVLTLPKSATQSEQEKCYMFIRGVLNSLSGHYVELSKQKYSSNVVEKSIVNSVILEDHVIFDELLAIPAIVQLLDNRYGTYVLQKTLHSLSGDDLKKVDAEVRDSRLINSGHGPSFLNKWKGCLNKVI